MNSMQLYKRLLQYTWPYKWIFAISITGMVITAACQPALAALMKPLLDGGFIEKDPEIIRQLPPMIVGLFLISGFGQFSGQYAMGWIGRRIIFDIRNVVFKHIMGLPTSFHDNNSSGVLISKVIYDIEQIAHAATKALFVFVKDSLTIIGLVAWMVYLNWQLTAGIMVVAPILAVFVRFMSTRFRKTSRGVQKSMGGISTVTQEAIEGHRIVKSFGAQKVEAENFRVVNEKNRQQATRRVVISAISTPVPEIIASFMISAVLYYALRLSEQGLFSPGQFISYFSALGIMMNPAKRLIKVNEIIQQGLAASESVFQVLDEPLEDDRGRKTLTKVEGRLEYRNVSFNYPGHEGKVLDNLSFMIEPGNTIALVGSSGSGKTTTANLLPRFYNISSGEILLDGINISELTLENLRKQVSIVSQEIILFNDTILNNIAYGSSGKVDAERVKAAAIAAHVDEFAEELPEKYETMVGEKGVRLSGGQRQRIAIARALYKNAPILVLDEATSALDAKSERFVQDAMTKLMKNKTTLIIAHRLSTIENANTILVLDKGEVIEKGSHQELLRNKGTYAKLYQNKFSDDLS